MEAGSAGANTRKGDGMRSGRGPVAEFLVGVAALETARFYRTFLGKHCLVLKRKRSQAGGSVRVRGARIAHPCVRRARRDPRSLRATHAVYEPRHAGDDDRCAQNVDATARKPRALPEPQYQRQERRHHRELPRFYSHVEEHQRRRHLRPGQPNFTKRAGESKTVNQPKGKRDSPPIFGALYIKIFLPTGRSARPWVRPCSPRG